VIQRLLFVTMLVVLALPAASAPPQRIGNFSTLMDALTKGGTVRVVAEYGRCRLLEGGDPRFAPARVGGLTVDTWRSYVTGGADDAGVTVILSSEELVADSRGGVLLLHVEFEIHHDDEVVITLRHLDPDTQAVVTRWKLATTIDRGDEGAAAFYRLD